MSSQAGKTAGVLVRHRDFRAVWIGQAFSAIGDPLFPFAIAFLALDRGDNALGVSALLAARALATVCAALAGGVLADRFRRTHVMIAADAVRLVAILSIVAVADLAPLIVLSLLVFVVGLGEAVFRPAYSAVVPALVPPEDRQAANALTSLAQRAGGFAGPALAAVLVTGASSQAALLVDAATFAVSIVSLLFVREPAVTREQTERSFLADVREGFVVVARRRWLAIEIGAGAVQITASLAPWLVLLPVVARDRHGGAGAYAGLLVAMSAGALIGALVGARISSRQPGVVASLALVPFTLALVGLALDWPLVLLLVLQAIAGIGTQVYGVLWVTAIQRSVPASTMARVFAIDQLGSLALLPLGMLLAGALADTRGAETVLVVAGVVNLLTAVGPLVFPDVRAFSDLPPPAKQADDHPAALTPAPE
jgi:MFS family permease